VLETGQIRNARRAQRRATDAPSTMRTDGGDPVDVLVLDLSRSGIRIMTDADLGIGQEISIGLAGAGVTRAFVTWARGGEYGCAFERPIGVEDEAAAFSRAPVKRLGRAVIERTDGNAAAEDYLQDLYRRHRVWALPWDAVLMTLAMLVLLWAFFRL
jgi:hypothetical protein